MARAPLIMLVLAAVLAGCGSGEGDPPRDAFVAEANAICRDGERKIAAMFDDERATPASLERIAVAYEPYLERLDRLDPPQELEPDWREFLAGVDEGFDLLPQIARAAEAQDEERLREISARAEDIADDTRPFAQTNGLDGCLPAEDDG